MKQIRDRARDSFPSVLLTLLSIVQAIALETLWEASRHRTDLFDPSWLSMISWLQLAATFFGIIFIWLSYVGLVMRFRITPELGDLIIPFFVGLFEFLLIEMTNPGRLGEWFVVLSVTAAMVTFFTHKLFKRARRDPANQVFFSIIQPATWRDHSERLLPATLSALAGIWIWQSGQTGWFALLAILFVWLSLFYQIWLSAKWWRISMGDDC